MNFKLKVAPPNLVLSSPLYRIRHIRLDLVNPGEGGEGLVQEERGVVHHHVDEPDKLFTIRRFCLDRHLKRERIFLNVNYKEVNM